MPRTTSCPAAALTLDEVLAESSASSLVTPAANKPVRIRPFKRTRFEDGPEPERSPTPEEPSKLSPRKLDMDQGGVVLASDLAEDDGDEEDDEDEVVQTTQPYPPPDEVEEGEIPALTRTTSAALS